MNELARQQYLEALGVQTYMPRVRLLAAPAPRLCDWSFMADALAPETEVGSAGPVSQGASAGPVAAGEPVQAARVLQSLRDQVQGARPARPAPRVQPASAVEPAFSVSLWQFAGLLVLADRDPGQALPVGKLLANILLALGHKQVDTSKPEVIRWPLEGLSAAQTGPADHYFASILSARRPAGQAASLLCFGERISASLDPQGEKALRLSDTDQLPLLRLPSLELLLTEPARKAAVWSAIAHLRIT